MVKFNGLPVTGIVFNGQTVKNLVYNGTHIWCTPPTAPTTHYMQRDAASFYPQLAVTNTSSLEIAILYKGKYYYAPAGGSVTLVGDKLTALPATGSPMNWVVLYGGAVETCVHSITFPTTYSGVVQG